MEFKELYKKYNVTNLKIKHMQDVAKLCIFINKMLDLEVNEELLTQSALLHDIGSAYYRGIPINDLNDFDKMWGHQVKTLEWLKREGLVSVAETASRHNCFGINNEESKEWGYKKGINLLPKSNESKILAFADSIRAKYIEENDFITIIHKDARELLKKHKMVVIAEERKKKLFQFLKKHGLDINKTIKYAKELENLE